MHGISGCPDIRPDNPAFFDTQMTLADLIGPLVTLPFLMGPQMTLVDLYDLSRPHFTYAEPFQTLADLI